MIKAKVTAENRPACETSQYVCTWTMGTAYEYERCVQILVVLVQKIPIVLLGLLAVLFVEFAAKIFHR